MVSAADLFVKWIHVSSACMLLGAAIVALVRVLPAVEKGPEATGQALAAVWRSVKMVVHTSLGLLLLTGIYNFIHVLGTPALRSNALYQQILGAKMLLYIITFGLGIAAFRKAANPDSIPGGRRTLVLGIVALTLLIVLLSTFLNLDHMAILKAPLNP